MSSKNKSPLKKFRKGSIAVITEIVTSFVFGFLMTLFAKDQLIGSDVVLIFTLVGFVGSIGLMFSFKSRGFVFLMGWILAAWLLRGSFSSFDFAVYLVAPVAVLALRTFFFFRKGTRRFRIL
ncbi:MAG: hypothetical protein Q7J73_02870 [Dehalococcoidales bacterium]|nr:hypothetical protein [Dehalococcoidales bacterium]